MFCIKKGGINGFYEQNFSLGKLFIASFFNLSTAQVYFSIRFNPLIRYVQKGLATVLR